MNMYIYPKNIGEHNQFQVYWSGTKDYYFHLDFGIEEWPFS